MDEKDTSVQVGEANWLAWLPFCLGGEAFCFFRALSRYIMENALHVRMDGWIGAFNVL